MPPKEKAPRRAPVIRKSDLDSRPKGFDHLTQKEAIMGKVEVSGAALLLTASLVLSGCVSQPNSSHEKLEPQFRLEPDKPQKFDRRKMRQDLKGPVKNDDGGYDGTGGTGDGGG